MQKTMKNNKQAEKLQETVQEHAGVERPEEAETLIELKDLSVFYGNNQAVKHVNMPLKKNKVTAFIGPSGCGKSTLLRTINRMNDQIPDAHYGGQIMYDGVNLLDQRIDVVSLRKEIGMVFQEPNPFPKPIKTNITHALKFYRTKKSEMDDIVESALKQAALWEEVKNRLGSSAQSLSGGQQQRLCIARALALKPQVLLLDEPTSALDPISSAKVEDLIIELKKYYTIVIVTHNMEQAARVSDYTSFMYNGDLIEFGSTSQLFTNPNEKRTEDYLTGKFS
ncbi:phosphate ABC transporter ATP-binding protein PstB [Halobacillus salinarum]|uniref:Phosphate ABC transporter ATP-binding protein PstB n=2 Tax=Halobacillus salinarum TaxID=2932257 RepID=A0ABY4EDI8_9BACI|nr:phosphate ABC transporter ATP-binding protein PstB [Halobacillus salinarum]UOQ42510.1 phosphate ABC transporter ATP-binding protein PstB [Halobacillus salinarum]